MRLIRLVERYSIKVPTEEEKYLEREVSLNPEFITHILNAPKTVDGARSIVSFNSGSGTVTLLVKESVQEIEKMINKKEVLNG